LLTTAYAKGIAPALLLTGILIRMLLVAKSTESTGPLTCVEKVKMPDAGSDCAAIREGEKAKRASIAKSDELATIRAIILPPERT
jgi:hypothetical protein